MLPLTNDLQVEVRRDGAPVALANITVTSTDPNGISVVRQGVTDAAGLALITGVQVGRAVLTVEYADAETFTATRAITIGNPSGGAGYELVDLSQAGGTTVRMAVFGQVAGSPARMNAQVSLAVNGIIRKAYTYTDQFGTPGLAEFFNVPDGPYVVWAEDAGTNQVGEEVYRQTVVPGIDAVDIQLSPVSELGEQYTFDGFRYSVAIDGSVYQGGGRGPIPSTSTSPGSSSPASTRHAATSARATNAG